MTPLYAYSLVPVLSVALLLCFSTLLHARAARGLALYCLSIAVWSGTLLLTYFPALAWLGQRLAACGALVAATYVHAAYDFTRHELDAAPAAGLLGQPLGRTLVWAAYAFAFCILAIGVAWPGLLYDPVSLAAGPLFWEAMLLAIAGATVPLWQLGRAYWRAEAERRVQLRSLAASGLMCYAGAWSNALLLSHGLVLPWGLFLVLGSLLLLAHVVRGQQEPRERRLLERSLLYSAVAALLSSGFLFGVVFLLWGSAEPLAREYGLGAFFLLCMASLAFEPLRQQAQQYLGSRLVPHHAHAAELARELAHQERRADQAERLAELGVFVSAVAHEVRNPLGVLTAHLRLLERAGADPSTLEAMHEQIDRAVRFVEDLLRYGRPRPLELRLVDVRAIVELAVSTARDGLGPEAPQDVEWLRDAGAAAMVEADQAQLLQVLVVLLENAALALHEAPVRRIRVRTRVQDGWLYAAVEDSGPGIAEELLPRVFEPFVTGRKREGRRPGTGLGLAIARRIVERHGGTIGAGRSELGGARFDLRIPQYQKIYAAVGGTS
jgi:signal transduction histidine kinase